MDFEPTEYDATCDTPECDNAGLVVRVIADSKDPFVICGVCGNHITNIAPIDASQEIAS